MPDSGRAPHLWGAAGECTFRGLWIRALILPRPESFAMPVLNIFGASPRRRASAMAAMTIVAAITTVGSLPAQAADVTTTVGADPTRPPKATEPIQTLTVSAEPTTTVQVDTFTVAVSAPGSAAAIAGSAAAAEAAAAEAAAAEAAAAEAAAAEAAAAEAAAAEAASAAAAAAAAVPAPAAQPAPAAAAPSPAVRWPFSGGSRISDTYGPRVAPCSGCSTFHDGLDMTPGAGTPIGAIADGVVSSVTATDSGGLGVHVMIDHVVNGQRVTSTYGHMTVGSLAVGRGQTVTAGQKLGTVGSTGQSTGPHLHLEIHLGGVTAVDPYAWLTTHAGPM